jgi:hypothetical protein
VYLYGDPGKRYGYGVFGGLDGTEWCPPPLTGFIPAPAPPADALWGAIPPAAMSGAGSTPADVLWGVQSPAGASGGGIVALPPAVPCLDVVTP